MKNVSLVLGVGFSRLAVTARWSLLAPASWLEMILRSLATSVLVLYADRLDPVRPTSASLGFWGWVDQGQYFSLVKILSSGRLPSAAEYTYGLGYPVIGLPFYSLGFTRDPFLVPDIVMACVSIVAVYIFATRLVGRTGALAVVTLLLVATPFIELASVPWTSIVTMMAVAVSLVIATATTITPGRAATIGVLAGFVFAARFVDVIIILAIGTWCVFTSGRGRRLKIGIAMAIPAAAIAASVAFTQKLAFGSYFITPYASHLQNGASDQSLDHYSAGLVVLHFLETFITARDGDQPVAASPLLALSPFLALAPVGMVLVLCWRRRTSRAARKSLHATLIAASLAMTSLYLSFVAGGGAELIYNNYRYWMPYYPYWITMAVLAASAVWRRVHREREMIDVAPASTTDAKAPSTTA